MNNKKWKILLGGMFVILIFIAPYFLTNPASYIYLDGINGVKPGTNGHLLGTDTLGRDVWAGIISGARISLIISGISVGIALFLALVFNLFTSYIGNNRVQLNSLQVIIILLSLPIFYYYSFLAFSITIAFSLFIFVGLLLVLHLILKKISSIGKPILKVPLDTIGQKFYEFFQSIPKLILLLIFIGLSPKNNIWGISLIIGCLMWPLFFRYIRLEILSEKANDRFRSLKNLGYGDIRIIFGQFLPIMLPILSTPIIFAVVSVIFLEANLSFLGLGMSGDYVTWGSLLAEAKRNTSAWWLIFFPGSCLFILFYVLNRWFNTDQKDFL